MLEIEELKRDYPWIQSPLVVGAPMRMIALAEMAVEVSKAGESYFTKYIIRLVFLDEDFSSTKHLAMSPFSIL